ncbi:MAG: DNA adenine methylase [Wolinella sp.]
MFYRSQISKRVFKACADVIEALTTKGKVNLLYLRQYLKMRIYSSNAENHFYNFRFAIKFLLKHKNIPKHDFIERIRNLDISFLCSDFRDLNIDTLASGKAFIYLDPPYILGIASYNENGGWTEKDGALSLLFSWR